MKTLTNNSMSTNYVPALNVSDVSLGSIAVGSTLPILDSITRPYLVMNVSKVTASGIRYTVGYDASGQRVISGTSAPGYISLTGMQSALSYSTWNTPSTVGFITASFVYASGTQQSVGIDIIKAEAAVPRASLGHQLAYIVSNILGLRSPASYTSTFSDLSTLASTFNTNIAQQVKAALELQSTQDALLKAIIMANGPLITATASGTYTLRLDGNMTDIIVSSDIKNITCTRTAYGKVNYLTIPSSIPILLRITSVLPDVLFDVDVIPNFTAGQQLTSWQNTGQAGTAFNATASGTTGVFMRVDASGRRYLETKGENLGFLTIPGGLPFMYATDSPFPGFTIAYVYKNQYALGTFLKISNSVNPNLVQFTNYTTTSLGYTHILDSSSNYLAASGIAINGVPYLYNNWIIQVISFRHNALPIYTLAQFTNAPSWSVSTPDIVSLTSGVTSLGPLEIYNMEMQVKAFHLYRYGMSQNQVMDLVTSLQQQYNTFTTP